RLDLDERGHVRGVVTTDGRTIAGRVVVDAAGAASRLADQMGLPRRPDRPMGVAVRAYVRGTAGAPAVGRIHSWLAPHDAAGARLTGYGWLFPLGDGLFNVGVGQLSTSPSFRHTDYRALLRDFVAGLPADWDLRFVGEPVRSAGGALEAPDVDRPQIHGAGLPMGFDRVVAYRRGLLLTGDAAGLVNPFNGEGVSYALRSGQLAGEAIVDAFRTPGGVGSPAAEAALQGYHHALKAEVDPYFRLGRLFARLIAHPGVVEAGLAHVLPHQAPMDPVNKVMANLIPPRGGGVGDRTLRLAVRLSGAV
ncbi:MAG: tryptophan 7-halogenase, partial [Actinomycetia bacterium]|nr:tryptophan 7-halogenase [Actinomycetes bacterium]